MNFFWTGVLCKRYLFLNVTLIAAFLFLKGWLRLFYLIWDSGGSARPLPHRVTLLSVCGEITLSHIKGK